MSRRIQIIQAEFWSQLHAKLVEILNLKSSDFFNAYEQHLKIDWSVVPMLMSYNNFW